MQTDNKITFHCLFEQSGTFRDVFKSYGHEAYCYDIQNEYGKTDFQIDLFREIEKEYDNITVFANDSRPSKTIFSTMKPETDFILAFFPCTYFTDLQEMNFRLEYSTALKQRRQNENNITFQQIDWLLKHIKNRAYFFEIWNKFCFVLQELKIKAIIENPAGGINRSYLTLYSPYRPSFTDKDRTLYGDKFRKPTNYFAINFDMKESFIMYDEEINKTSLKSRKRVNKVNVESNQRKRSEITPRYANNFYKRFLEQPIKEWNTKHS